MSVEAEHAVLGGLMLDNTLVDDVAEKITADDFQTRATATTFNAMLALRQSNQPVDIVTLSDHLEQSGDLHQVGGVAFLGELEQNAPNPERVPKYAKIIKRQGRRRRVKVAADDIKAAIDEGEEPDRAISEFVYSVGETGQAKAHRVGDPVKRVMAASRERAANARDGIPGAPCQLPAVNKVTGGAMGSDVWIVAGRTSTGKTALALGWCQEAGRRGYKSAYFSLEMEAEILEARMCANAYGVDLRKLLFGDDEAMEELAETHDDRPVDWPIWIDDETFDAETIVMRINALRRKHELDFVVIDHLGLIEPPRSSQKKSEVSQIGDVTRMIHRCAKQNDIPIICLHQLNRANEKEGRKPGLADLRGSGHIEQDADVIAFIHIDKDSAFDVIRPINIGIAKNRNGPVGWLGFKFRFNGSTQQYREIDKSQAIPKR